MLTGNMYGKFCEVWMWFLIYAERYTEMWITVLCISPGDKAVMIISTTTAITIQTFCKAHKASNHSRI